MTTTCPKCDLIYDSYDNPVCPKCGLKANIRNSDEANDHDPEMKDQDEDYTD